MSEKGCARWARLGCIGGEMTAPRIQFSLHENARRVHIGDFMSRQIVEVIRARATGGLTDALALSIVDIASGGRGTGPQRAIHLNEAVFGVIKVSMCAGARAVAGQIARSVVTDACHACDAVVCVEAQL